MWSARPSSPEDGRQVCRLARHQLPKDYLDGDRWVPGAIGILLIAGLAIVWYRVAVFQAWRIWDKSASDLLATRLFKLPVSIGPSTLLFVRKEPVNPNDVLDLQITREYPPENPPNPPVVHKKPPEDAADLDRRNGIALFFLAVMSFPIAPLIMSLVDSRETTGWLSPKDWWTAPSLLWLAGSLIALIVANLFLGRGFSELWTTSARQFLAWLRAPWRWVRTGMGRRDAPAERA